MFGNLFNLNYEKTEFEKKIEKDGIDHAVRVITNIVINKLPSPEIAYQFLLEELDASRQGNDEAQAFAKNSGVSSHEYIGALNNSIKAVDGADGPQQFLNNLGMQLMNNPALMVQLRTSVVKNIMEHFSFGSIQGIPLNNIRLKIENENAEIVAVAVNEKIIYINTESEDLYPIIMQPDPDSRYTHNIDGRAVVFQLIETATKRNIEIFLAVGDENKNLQGLLDQSFSLLIEHFPNLLSYDSKYQISVYDEEDSRVMKKEDEMGVFFYSELDIAYILGKNEYKKMSYRTYLSEYTDFDDYTDNMMNDLLGDD